MTIGKFLHSWLILLMLSVYWHPAYAEVTDKNGGTSASEAKITPKAGMADNGVSGAPEPYGANLFDNRANTGGAGSINPNYTIVIGDRIQLKMWGVEEAQADEVVTVDPQGNIFLRGVGPIPVAGISAGNLQDTVQKAVREVYFDTVEVYASLLSANTLNVFVTGPVRHPGQYSGLSSDSALAFLQKAGGIDPQRGSYRRIDILRDGGVMESIDLYAFLLSGQLPSFRFQEGDTVLVHPQGETVTVTGAGRNPFQFEFLANPDGNEIARYARPRSNVSHVRIKGTRPEGPFSTYVPYEQFLGYRFSDGDEIRFEADQQLQSVDISVEGSYDGPSSYSVRKDTTLQEMLDYIPVDLNDADVHAVYLKRKSVAEKQSKLLEESLRRLEQNVLTAPVSSDGEALVRTKEAELVIQFVDRAKQYKPEGRVVVSENGSAANIRLEDGDVIVIPRKSDVVTVGGEVLLPQAVVYMKGARVGDYVAKAGGLTERGDSKRILVVHPNGAVDLTTDALVNPGDEIMVMPRIDTKNVQLTKDITQIIYQIAVAARAATGL